MNREELQEEMDTLLHPEPEEDGFPPREFPHPRITDFHRLDASYMMTLDWEGSSIHPHTRFCPPDEDRLTALSQNSDVPYRLFEAGLRLCADSIIAYHDEKECVGNVRYYPSIIMTFWAGFESFVRYRSDIMLITVKRIPQVVANYLREKEVYLNRRGEAHTKERYQPTLERYVVLLKYGYGFVVDRGNTHWQNLQKAKELRDYYTHLDVAEPKAVSSSQVLDYLEAIMLGLIWPSCELKRTLFLGAYRLYEIWAGLLKLHTEYVEQPAHKDWSFKEGFMFHCNFENVDSSRFPNLSGLVERKRKDGNP